MIPVPARGDYIAGRFEKPAQPDGEIRRESPADIRQNTGVFSYSVSSVDDAVAAAREAQPSWYTTPLEGRIQALARLKSQIQLRSDELARLIAVEVGKPLWESRQEARALISKIDITVAEAARWIQPNRPTNLQGGIDWRPLGVIAIIGPFNFPVHLPHGQAVPALLAGNTVVIKPSPLAPATGQLYAELIDAAQFPPGAVNVIQGETEVGARLVAHPDVNAVHFTGSWTAGRSILAATLDQPQKLVALEMGGKNAATVLSDADLSCAAFDVVVGAFATAGQRCTATSRLVVEKAVAAPLVDQILKLTKNLNIGHPLDENVFLGPLVSEAARKRFVQALECTEGAEAILSGCVHETENNGWYVRPSVHRIVNRDKSSRYQHDELFGPDLAIYQVDDFAEALSVTNDTAYGLVASLFSRNKSRWMEFRKHVRAGVLHWNRTTIGASSRLPFGGLGCSGNYRPGGLFTIQSCVAPVSYLEGGADVQRPPGIFE